MSDVTSATFLVTPDPQVKVRDDWSVLIGGSPTRVFKLSPRGSAAVKSWFGGAPVVGKDEVVLANRLLQAGLAHPVPPDLARQEPSLTYSVVIPHRNDANGLAATLDCLADNPATAIEVVQDNDEVPLGPAAARNLGASRTSGEVIVFIDAGVTIEPSEVAKLVSYLLLEDVVAAAPRIRCSTTEGLIGTYEQNHFPLDLGQLPGLVAPGNRISYVPSTVLAVRRDAFEACGGFDPNLRYGEDVDLVWRLDGDVRYAPEIVAHHPARNSIAELARQRYNYGTSAGPLGVKHGDAVAPVAMSGWTLVTLALALFPAPKMLIAWLAGMTVGLSTKIDTSTPVQDAASLTVGGHLGATEALARATTRTWWPLAAISLATSFRSRTLLAIGWSLLKNRHPLALVDDMAYGLGVWRGTLRAKSARSVLPRGPQTSD